MISLPELQAKARRQYEKVLRAHLAGEGVFPLLIPANKSLDRQQGGEHIHAQQLELLLHSKNKTGRGYTLTFKPNARTRQSEISRITFDTLADFLGFLGRQAEFDQFAANAARTTAALPELLGLPQLPRLLLDHAADWPGLLTVCAYFKANPQPNLHVRSLPLALPTKFVEQHQTALRPLLDYLIPDYVQAEASNFSQRYNLLLEEPGVKVRFLGAAGRLHPALSQCSLWVSELAQMPLAVQRVFIIENLTSFLAFPAVPDAVAIWGGGFAVGGLGTVQWLRDKQLFYWGDIDVHGFQILAQLRAHFSTVQSLLMDEATFARYHGGGQGGAFLRQELPGLTAAEQPLYQHLLATNARLEQEQLPPQYVAAQLRAAIGDNASAGLP